MNEKSQALIDFIKMEALAIPPYKEKSKFFYDWIRGPYSHIYYITPKLFYKPNLCGHQKIHSIALMISIVNPGINWFVNKYNKKGVFIGEQKVYKTPDILELLNNEGRKFILFNLDFFKDF